MHTAVWGLHARRLATAIALTTTATFAMPVFAAPDADEAEDDDEAASDDDEGDEDAAVEAEASVTAPKPKVRKKKSKAKRPAAPMKNRVGFGAMRTLAGLNGLMLRWYAADRFTVGFNLGAATFSHGDTDENGDFERTRTVGAVGAGPEFFFWPYQGDRSQQVHADFGVGARVTTYFGFLGQLEEEQSDTLDTPLEIDVEVPASIQLFIGKRVAVIPEFGVAFRIIPGNREPDQNGEFDANPGRGIGSQRGTTDGPGFGFDLGDHGGLFMGIGFAYFFGDAR
ncbi:MAG: hypothetical protein AAGA54_01690 [Myxococcota bacterium]